MIYRSEKEKFDAIADEIERLNRYDQVLLERRRADRRHVPRGNRRRDRRSCRKIRRSRKTIPTSKIKDSQRRGRPILVGTVSIEKSERLSSLLDKRGIKHQVLNAKHHEREAEIVAQAGRKAPSRSPRTWPAAVPTSSSAATPRRWPGPCCKTSTRRGSTCRRTSGTHLVARDRSSARR